MSDITEAQRQTIADAVRAEVGRFCRLGAPMARDDMAQEAWQIGLIATRTHREGRAPLGSYLRSAIRRGVGAAISSQLATVHVAWHQHHRAREFQNRTELPRDRPGEGETRAVPEQLRDAGTPEQHALGRERELLLLRWRKRVRGELRACALKLDDGERTAALALVLSQTPQEVAARLDLPVERVYEVARRLHSRFMRSARLARLWMERRQFVEG